MATESALQVLGELIGGALALDRETFIRVSTIDARRTGSLIVLVLAALSQGIGQGVILFMNRVKPLRFILSLAIGAILFAIGYLFWAGCIWLVARFWFQSDVTLFAITRTLGYAYAPFLFGFLIALPYFGVPISMLLNIWTLLATIVGLQAVTGLDNWDVFVCAIAGSVVQQALQRTVGRPIDRAGQWISNAVAGVKLVRDEAGLEQLLADADFRYGRTGKDKDNASR